MLINTYILKISFTGEKTKCMLKQDTIFHLLTKIYLENKILAKVLVT